MAAQAILYGASAISQLYLGFAQADLVKQQADLQADIANFNAQLTEYEGWKQQKFGQEVIARTQSEQDQILGKTKVSAAAAGVKITDGTMSEIVNQNKLNSMLNIADISNRVSESVMGYKRKASNLRLQGRLNQSAATIQASSMRAAALTGAVGAAANYGISQQKGEDYSKSKKTTSTGWDFDIMNEDYKTKTSFDAEPGFYPYARFGMPGGD